LKEHGVLAPPTKGKSPTCEISQAERWKILSHQKIETGLGGLFTPPGIGGGWFISQNL